MKILTTFLLLTFLTVNALKAQALKTPQDSLSYSLGVLIGNSIMQQGFMDLNPDMIMAGMKSMLAGEPTLISIDECSVVVREVSSKAKMKEYEANKKAGEDYLAANKKRTGVTTLSNGLQYEILKAGDGPKPLATDKVLVHYHGTSVDGQVFDSSVERGTPASFRLNQVITGWTEILQLMPVGSKWKVFIPYTLAYGEQGNGPNILPFSALIFEIELLEIQ